MRVQVFAPALFARQAGKAPKLFGWIHERACPSENELNVAGPLKWRGRKLALHPRK